MIAYFIISLGFCGCFSDYDFSKLLSDTFTTFQTGRVENVYEVRNVGLRTAYERTRPGEATSVEPLYSALAATVEAQENCAAATRRLMLQYERLMDLDIGDQTVMIEAWK